MVRIAKPGSIWNKSQFSYDSEAIHNAGPERINGTKSFVQGPRWLKQYIAAATTLVSGSAATVIADTTIAGFTITLPLVPNEGDWFTFVDTYGKWGTNSLTIAPNGINLDGSTSNLVLSTNYGVRGILFDGTGWHSTGVGKGTAPTQTVLTGSGTYTTPRGCTAIQVECVGGGGAGGGTAATGVGQLAMGGGGGGGAYASSIISGPAASYAYVAGAGGTGVNGAGGNAGASTTFGSTLVVATPGAPGALGSATTGPNMGVAQGGGGNSAACTGSIALSGQPGTRGFAVASNIAFGGAGGNAAGGAGGVAGVFSNAAAGTNSQGHGSGGGGGMATASQAAQTGGNGGDGYIVVTEYYN